MKLDKEDISQIIENKKSFVTKNSISEKKKISKDKNFNFTEDINLKEEEIQDKVDENFNSFANENLLGNNRLTLSEIKNINKSSLDSEISKFNNEDPIKVKSDKEDNIEEEISDFKDRYL
jgi:hypothetical protein